MMKFKLDNLQLPHLTLSIACFLLCPMQVLASGVEARRAYVTGKHVLALQLAQPAAEQGDSTAMLVLGSLYFNGAAVRQDYAAAFRWWRAAAALGNVRAQSNMGILFRDGLGVERNYEEAIKWFALAAAHEEAYAHWHLAQMRENGQGFPVDINKALELYKKAQALLRRDLVTEPENRDPKRWIDALGFRINWLTSLIAQSQPVAPMPSTSQSSSGQQTPPR